MIFTTCISYETCDIKVDKIGTKGQCDAYQNRLIFLFCAFLNLSPTTKLPISYSKITFSITARQS